MKYRRWRFLVVSSLAAVTWLLLIGSLGQAAELSRVKISDDGKRFVLEGSGQTFRPWGVNYDHDDRGRLIEDYWHDEWESIVEDFAEIKALGANVVRIHLQVSRFMESAEQTNAANLKQLRRLIEMAESTGLYLDLTGLSCYHRKDVPEWYQQLDESRRWAAQAFFWEAIARTCAEHPAVFCFDLMNEPVVPGQLESDWLVGEFGGKYFVQRITLDPAGRSSQQIAKAWVEQLVASIRKHDPQTLVTVGAIPWALQFPSAKPLFYSPEVGANLDFVSVHFYPRSGKVDAALTALTVYNVGKPVVVEETFPLQCSIAELEDFIGRASQDHLAQGWMSFYWGKTADEYSREGTNFSSILMRQWLLKFSEIGICRPDSTSP